MTCGTGAYYITYYIKYVCIPWDAFMKETISYGLVYLTLLTYIFVKCHVWYDNFYKMWICANINVLMCLCVPLLGIFKDLIEFLPNLRITVVTLFLFFYYYVPSSLKFQFSWANGQLSWVFGPFKGLRYGLTTLIVGTIWNSGRAGSFNLFSIYTCTHIQYVPFIVMFTRLDIVCKDGV